MSTPEEYAMSLYDLHLKKKFLICLKKEVEIKIEIVQRYIDIAEENKLKKDKEI